MKLFICPTCQDIVRLIPFVNRTCMCGDSHGMVDSMGNATIHGDAVPLGIDNATLMRAIVDRPASGQGSVFVAFVIPTVCRTVNGGAFTGVPDAVGRFLRSRPF